MDSFFFNWESIYSETAPSNDKLVDDLLNGVEFAASGKYYFNLRTLVHVARQRLIVERIRRDEDRSERFYRFVNGVPRG